MLWRIRFSERHDAGSMHGEMALEADSWFAAVRVAAQYRWDGRNLFGSVTCCHGEEGMVVRDVRTGLEMHLVPLEEEAAHALRPGGVVERREVRGRDFVFVHVGVLVPPDRDGWEPLLREVLEAPVEVPPGTAVVRQAVGYARVFAAGAAVPPLVALRRGEDGDITAWAPSSVRAVGPGAVASRPGDEGPRADGADWEGPGGAAAGGSDPGAAAGRGGAAPAADAESASPDSAAPRPADQPEPEVVTVAGNRVPVSVVDAFERTQELFTCTTRQEALVFVGRQMDALVRPHAVAVYAAVPGSAEMQGIHARPDPGDLPPERLISRTAVGRAIKEGRVVQCPAAEAGLASLWARWEVAAHHAVAVPVACEGHVYGVLVLAVAAPLPQETIAAVAYMANAAGEYVDTALAAAEAGEDWSEVPRRRLGKS